MTLTVSVALNCEIPDVGQEKMEEMKQIQCLLGWSRRVLLTPSTENGVVAGKV